MSEEIKVSKPVSPVQPQTMSSPVSAQGGSSKMPWVVLAVVVVLLVVGGVMFRDKIFSKQQNPKVMGATTTAYQAVFLTNGQVYFGKLSDVKSDYVTLEDIYYLQVVQPPLQGQQQPGQTSATSGSQPQISLVKLGNELHGPIDQMHISRQQILFYEDLKEDGQVVKAIIQDKNTKK